MRVVFLVSVAIAAVGFPALAQGRRPAARPAGDRTERILADSTVIPARLGASLRRLIDVGVESASLGFPSEPVVLIATVRQKYGRPDSVRVAARGPSGPGLPPPQVDSLFVYGRLELGVAQDGPAGRIGWVTLRAPPTGGR